MRFERLSAVVTYLLVAVGFLVLFLSGELPVLYWAVFLPAFCATMLFGGRPALQSARLWNTVLVVALLFFGVAGYSSGDWLSNAIYFASLMVVAKLFQRRSSQDYFQLYVLSFLQLVAGAVVNPTVSFAVCFLMYVVLLTWALVILHLRRDLEKLGAEPAEPGSSSRIAAPLRMQRLLTGGFLAGTSALALSIFACSVVVFLFFPRLGLGFFGAHRQTGSTVSGFSEQVDLGGFGRLKSDRTAIMRVEIEGSSARDVLPLRLKGITFDAFDGRRWSKSKAPWWPLSRTEADGFFGVQTRGRLPGDGTRFTQKVYLENLNIDRKVIFAEQRVVGVRDMRASRYAYDWRKLTRFFQDSDLDLTYQTSGDGPLRYEVTSVRVGRPAGALRADVAAHDPEEVRPYLQLPDGLDPAVADLARKVTAGRKNDFERAIAVEEHLLAGYQYSLDGGHDPRDPLGDFLFGRRSGHCEFFATAMVVLLRARGIPARMAGGFYGGEHNDVGDYILVRQADAHSWVEVLFPEWGWIAFDPTPAADVLVGQDQSLLARIGRYFDSLDLMWHKWVIRWDLERQIELLRGIGRGLGDLRKMLPDSGGGGLGRAMSWIREKLDLRLAAGLGVCLLAVALLLLRRRLRRLGRRGPGRPEQRKRSSRRDERVARRLYRALLRVAARRGVEVGPATTAGTVVAALRRTIPGADMHAGPIVKAYEAVVFGGIALDPMEARACRDQLRLLRKRGS